MIELSTDMVPAGDSLDYWGGSVFRRIAISATEPRRPFRASLRRMASLRGEVWDHRSEAITVERDAGRCARDGGDEIYLGLLADGPSQFEQNGRAHAVTAGDLYVIDFARPVKAAWSAHREIAVVLPRAALAECLGYPVGEIGGQVLPRGGMTTLLTSHLLSLTAEAARLTPQERDTGLAVACELACAALRPLALPVASPRGEALLAAARRLIARDCTDPNLSPERLAMALGCSRAQLYRAFAEQEDSVATAIWNARLDCARALLTEPRRSWSASEVAMRCGFLDASNFSRMFKRRFGASPGQMRDG